MNDLAMEIETETETAPLSDVGNSMADESMDEGETPSVCPDGLGEKFWDRDKGEIRTEALIKSYRALERKLGGLAGRGVPETAEGYEIETEGELMTPDPEVNEILHEAGFTQAQAQTVYSLAAERPFADGRRNGRRVRGPEPDRPPGRPFRRRGKMAGNVTPTGPMGQGPFPG